jgi:hypothetical protein
MQGEPVQGEPVQDGLAKRHAVLRTVPGLLKIKGAEKNKEIEQLEALEHASLAWIDGLGIDCELVTWAGLH